MNNGRLFHEDIAIENAKAKLVVQDAGAYQAMLDELDRSRFIEAIRQGFKESEQGLGRPAEVVFAEMKAKYDFETEVLDL
jgi:hypothetical protein